MECTNVQFDNHGGIRITFCLRPDLEEEILPVIAGFHFTLSPEELGKRIFKTRKEALQNVRKDQL